ncbi:TrbI/VirB10 family protein [Cetobacterium sp. 2A]|uniref:TrbI/VirB10 family protein n=1 Tax=Cetobacterium sp. 2A TaxID=2754723 RepID=UPI00163C8C2F|nr:TrbI/VirB10 family protein [Cetobacterium sp. 2A]MBC2857002.1 TrbI/VirB10 family protein [Cetobacterium sp. 2A]
MNKKDILNKIPKPENKKGINYKNIAIAILIITLIILISFLTVDRKNNKNTNKNIQTAEKIEESEVVAGTTEELKEIIGSNPVLQEGGKIAAREESGEEELNKIRLQQEYELKRLSLALEQERIERLKVRERTPINLVEQDRGKELRYEKEKTGYEGLVIPPLPPFPKEDPNLQEAKEKFFLSSNVDEFVLKNQLQHAISNYEVKGGTIVPLTLETAINTDIAGDITAVVKRDIYDSKTGSILLIPSGSRVIGKYNSNVSFGQERAQVVFNRITLPNQKSINIGSMKGVDKLGASGVTDKVDSKIAKVFSSVVMSAILGMGTGAVKNDSEDGENWRNDAIDGGGTQALNVGNSYANKLLNVQPSLKIRQGYSVGLFIDKDLILEAYSN